MRAAAAAACSGILPRSLERTYVTVTFSVLELARAATPFPVPLSDYPSAKGVDLLFVLHQRIAIDPFNAFAAAIFLLAVAHTFFAARITHAAHALQIRKDARARAAGEAPRPSVAAELLHFFGEVEVVFGLWAVPLVAGIAATRGWETATHYVDETVDYTEAMFVVVIMAIASTQPVIDLAEAAVRRLASLGGGTPAAWWITILTMAPLLGSLVTEPAAMTIAALLLARQFYNRHPGVKLKYATLGLLFVNISIGGTLTHFAAPPVLMVARPWNWDTPFMLEHFGWRVVLGLAVATGIYYAWFRGELARLAGAAPADAAPAAVAESSAGPRRPIPAWVTAVHLAFMAWTVINAHHPALFLGGFLFFLGFDRATAVYSSLDDFKTPLLVGLFLAGLVIHGGLQGWWIGPVLSSLTKVPLFVAATALTAFNDNALITYLATLVPDLDDQLKLAVVRGAVTGGGLTVIANAANPAGQALLGRFFEEGVNPVRLVAGAALPTIVAAAIFLMA